MREQGRRWELSLAPGPGCPLEKAGRLEREQQPRAAEKPEPGVEVCEDRESGWRLRKECALGLVGQVRTGGDRGLGGEGGERGAGMWAVQERNVEQCC